MWGYLFTTNIQSRSMRSLVTNRLCGFAALLFVFVASSADHVRAQTKDVECRIKDMLAVLVISKRHRVTTHTYPLKKFCNFSVDGAVMSVPKYEDKVEDALNDIHLLYEIYSKDETRSRQTEFNLTLADLKGSLVYLYATAGPATDGSVPPQLFEAVAKNEEMIIGCLKDFYRGMNSKELYKRSADKKAICSVFTTNISLKTEALEAVILTDKYRNGLYTFR